MQSNHAQNAPSAIEISHVAIRQDDQGRYCLNDFHKASGGQAKHKPSNWLASQQTKELVAEIEKDDAGIPASKHSKAGIPALVTKRGGSDRGTYVVRELVFSYAMWISAKFHLQVIRAYDAQLSGNSGQLPNGLKRIRKTGSPEALTITPLELDALIDQRVKQVLEGEVELKADCPKYHYPMSDWQLRNRVGATGWLTFEEVFRPDPGQRCTSRLFQQHRTEGDDVSGAEAEVKALYLLLESYRIRLDRIRLLLADLERVGLNVRMEG